MHTVEKQNFNSYFICFETSLLSFKIAGSKFSPHCAELLLSWCWFVLLLSICYCWSKPNSVAENENGFYVQNNNINGFPHVFLHHSGKPVAIYLFLSNYSLVNTEKEAQQNMIAQTTNALQAGVAGSSTF